jgi:hypothetical protein
VESAKALRQAVPKGEMSGLVNVNKSNKSIASWLHGEGFLHAGESTPYTCDERVIAHTLQTTTRLHMYPDVDYGAYTDEECEQ